MRKVKIKSIEDIETLPEGEWVEVPEGLHAKFCYEVSKKAYNYPAQGSVQETKGRAVRFF
ncbi:MAG: hypothetical protein LRZ87_04580 [Methanocellales archaeon]|nr:hypothetical protein [Methanocellales archaeon]